MRVDLLNMNSINKRNSLFARLQMIHILWIYMEEILVRVIQEATAGPLKVGILLDEGS